jgi:hypothetical protein
MISVALKYREIMSSGHPAKITRLPGTRPKQVMNGPVLV